MAFVELADMDLWYEDTGGDSPPMVFLHPFTGTTDVWVQQTPAFVEAGYRCIAYDRRGWGRSQDHATGETHASKDLAGLVAALNLAPFHLVATGGGGYIALDYAVSHGDDLRSLVVSCSGGPLQSDEEYMAVGREFGRIEEFSALPAWFKELGPAYRAANPQGVARWIEVERASRQRESYTERLAHRITLRTLEELSVPTLMIAGGADLYAPSPRMAIMASHIPDCRLEVMGEAGHGAHWEQPNEWNALVLKFIGER